MIHGGGHPASCWGGVAAQLASRGHHVVAPDLPCEELEAGLAEYADAAVEATSGVDAPFVVVGHSMGGLILPLVAERLPIERMVFVSALVPVPGISFTAYAAEHPETLLSVFEPDQFDELGMRKLLTWEFCQEHHYNKTPPSIAREAWTQLRRQGPLPTAQVCPLAAWPAEIESTYIIYRDDHAVNPAWARAEIPQLLGIDVIELPGDHLGFLSDPSRLTRALVEQPDRI